MKKRILALSLAAAMVIGALASCTKTAEPVSSAPVEERDIKLVMWGSEKDNAFLKEVSAEWAKAYADANADVKSVTVDVQIKGEDTAADDAMNDIEAAADVFGIANGNLSKLVSGNAIYKLPAAVVDEVKAVVGDASLSSTVYNGDYYGFPYAPDTAEILFYNKSMYTEDEVKDLQVMLDKDLGAVTNLMLDLDNSWNAMTWAATAGAELFTGGDKTVDTMNKPEVAEMLKWLKEQIDAKKVADISSNTDFAAILKEGKAAGGFYGSWSKPDFMEALGDNYGVAELPSLNGTHLKCFGGSKMLVLNAMTKEPEAALALSQYIISEDVQLKRFKEVGQTPTAVALANNEDIKADAAVAAEVAQGAYTLTNQPLNGDAKFWDLYKAVMTDIKDGKLAGDDIQTALDKMVEDMTANLG